MLNKDSGFYMAQAMTQYSFSNKQVNIVFFIEKKSLFKPKKNHQQTKQ